MTSLQGSIFARVFQRRALVHWVRAARRAPDLPLLELRRLRAEAGSLRHELDRVLHVADGRLARPLAGDGIERPWGCDWAWRPELWTGPVFPQLLVRPPSGTRFGREVTVFHDDPGAPDVALRQGRSTGEGVSLDVYGFAGTFLSLVLELPEGAIEGLRRSHLLRLSARIAAERPLRIFSRLNVRHGPNTEQLLRALPGEGGEKIVDFDLAYTRMNEKRVEKVWVDLIFEEPRMNRVTIADLTFLRHPRADI